MEKIENKFTFASAIFNLISSILCFACFVWFLIEILTGHVFGLPSEGVESIGKVLIMLFTIAALIPLSLFSVLHLISFFSIKKTAFFPKDKYAVNNVYNNPKRLVPFILPFIGYIVFSAILIIHAIRQNDFNTIYFAIGMVVFALIHLLLPLPDVIIATKN